MVRLYIFIYNFLWTLIFIILFPFLIFSKNSRLGRKLFFNSPDVPDGKNSIWIHALSVGEVISAIPLYHALREQYPARRIIFTIKTTQGMEIAKKSLSKKGETPLSMPLDFWWPMDRMIRLIDPCLCIIVEGDIWPGMIHRLNSKGVKVMVINGRISPRTFNSYKRFGFLSKSLLNYIDLFLMQSELDRTRLLEIGVDNHRILTTGNLKFDQERAGLTDHEKAGLISELGFNMQDKIWVAGSTHDGEHTLILDVFIRIIRDFPELRLIIAPRDPESAQSIYDRCNAEGLRAFRRTDRVAARQDCQVLILDTIGELGRIYGISEISFVGGSLVPIGGHNLLEPAGFGRPVLFGPYTHNFVLMSELLVQAGGGIRVKDDEDLYVRMHWLLSDQKSMESMGKKAKKFVETNQGALGRILESIRGYIQDA